jgi:hypothetical protein
VVGGPGLIARRIPFSSRAPTTEMRRTWQEHPAFVLSPKEDVQHNRPDDRDEEHESDRDEYRHAVGLPGEGPRDAIDAEFGEAERAKSDDREDERAHEQNLARRLHETRLPGSHRLEPTGRPR